MLLPELAPPAEDPGEAAPADPPAPDADELSPPLPDAAGGQSLLLAVELPLELELVLGEDDALLPGAAAWLPGGQSADEPPAALLGELVSDGLVLGELVSDELVLGELVLGELVLGELLSDELVLGELEYEPLDDCAIAPAENASSALAVAAASSLSFIWGFLSRKASICDAVVGIVRDRFRSARAIACKPCSRRLAASCRGDFLELVGRPG